MKRLQLLTRVDPELREAVSKAAGEEGISLNDLVIKALENYLGIPKDSSAIKVDNSSAITTLAERITALEIKAITVDNSSDSTSVINDRFLALESKIEGLEQQLKTIVESGTAPQKTPPKKAKTIAPEGTIAKVSWKSLIAEFPDKNLDELCEIARERYPEKEAKETRDSIRRAMEGAKAGKQPLNLAPLPKD